MKIWWCILCHDTWSFMHLCFKFMGFSHIGFPKTLTLRISKQKQMYLFQEMKKPRNKCHKILLDQTFWNYNQPFKKTIYKTKPRGQLQYNIILSVNVFTIYSSDIKPHSFWFNVKPKIWRGFNELKRFWQNVCSSISRSRKVH